MIIYLIPVLVKEKILQCYVTEKLSNETNTCIIPLFFVNSSRFEQVL